MLPTFLEVSISLTFFYFIASMFISGITEFINSLFEKRHKFLWHALNKIGGTIEGKRVVDIFSTTVLMKHFSDGTTFLWRRPVSYIQPSLFVQVLLNELTNKADARVEDIEYFREAILKQQGEIKDLLLSLVKKSNTQEEFQANIEAWYNAYMEQISYWYKRYNQRVVWAVSIGCTLLFNLDTIKITSAIYNNPALRATMVQQATNVAQQSRYQDFVVAENVDFMQQVGQTNPSLLSPQTAKDSLKLKELFIRYQYQKASDLGIPIGWGGVHSASELKATVGSIQTVLGWIITISALSYGAPFWFEVLVKLVNIRNVSKRPEVAKAESKKAN
ncbi:hypothetical protein [Flectobacillus major]|uniref:hypothetical protein n=1 Tax=Flectobacillus major TaxID=103 RepID=UPI0004256979|nr:hypothetical protein [Flectobacillus major]